MAENKREDWEIDRDRAEIAQLLARYRRMPSRRIADILYERRRAEYKKALAELDALDSDSPIPNPPPPPYQLTRQMIDYDRKAIRADLKKFARQKFEEHLAEQLGRALELHEEAWQGYERSLTVVFKIKRETETVDLKTTVGGIIEGIEGSTLGNLLSTGDLRRKVELKGAQRVKELREKAQSTGEPRYLLVADRAQARIERLLGLEAATKVDVNVDSRKALAELLGVKPDALPDPTSNDPAQ